MMNLQPTLSTTPPDIGAILTRFFSSSRRSDTGTVFPQDDKEIPAEETLDEIYLQYPELGAYVPLVEQLERETRQRPDDPDVHFKLVVGYSQLKQWERVIDESHVVISLLHNLESPYRNIKVGVTRFLQGYAYGSIALRQETEGDVEQARNNLAKAEQAHLEAVKHVHNFPEAYYYLGVVNIDLDHIERGISFYFEAIKIKPDYSEAYNDLGVIYLRLNRKGTALNFFSYAVRVNPKNLISVKNLGKTYLEIESWQEAREALNDALELDPNDADTVGCLGVCSYYLGELDTAETYLKKALELDPKDAFARSNLGSVYARRGLFQEARNEIMQALRVDPFNPAIYRNLRFVNGLEIGNKRTVKMTEAAVQSRGGTVKFYYGTEYGHIVLDQDGIPTIRDANTKVIELVQEVLAYGWSSDELQYQHPHLSMGQIYSALAYYWDHYEELNQNIELRLEQVEGIRKEIGPSALRTRLKSKGL